MSGALSSVCLLFDLFLFRSAFAPSAAGGRGVCGQKATLIAPSTPALAGLPTPTIELSADLKSVST
jgi:hypothetical protein